MLYHSCRKHSFPAFFPDLNKNEYRSCFARGTVFVLIESTFYKPRKLVKRNCKRPIKIEQRPITVVPKEAPKAIISTIRPRYVSQPSLYFSIVCVVRPVRKKNASTAIKPTNIITLSMLLRGSKAVLI